MESQHSRGQTWTSRIAGAFTNGKPKQDTSTSRRWQSRAPEAVQPECFPQAALTVQHLGQIDVVLYVRWSGHTSSGCLHQCYLGPILFSAKQKGGAFASPLSCRQQGGWSTQSGSLRTRMRTCSRLCACQHCMWACCNNCLSAGRCTSAHALAECRHVCLEVHRLQLAAVCV